MSANIDLCAVPIGTRPDGTWDFVHYESLETASITVCVILTVLAMAVAVPRVYVNRRRLLIADYFTILALVFSIAYCVLISLMGRYYRQDWHLPACWFDGNFAKLQFCLVFFSGLVQFFPRASIFLLYRQLFQVHSGAANVAIWVGLVGTFLANAPNIPISIAIEAPHPGESWADVLVRLSKPSNGHDFRLWGPIQGGASVVLDIFAFILPLPIIARLNLARGRRIQLLVLFSTAFLAVAASIIAFYYKVKLLILENENKGGQMWLLGPVNICIDVESNVAIVVGSMPAFANFMRIHVVETGVFRSLRSMLRGTDPGEDESSESKPQRPLHGTIGSPLPRRKPKPMYYELTDTNALDSKLTTNGGVTVTTSVGISETRSPNNTV